MAGKKKKKKEKKNLSGSLSHIASHLFPSAIFAAVPRSATPNLSSTWPRTTPSSVAQAVGGAGNIGFACVGDPSRSSSQAELEGSLERPAQLPSTSQQSAGADYEDEDTTYEAVDITTRSENYDKKTKFDHTRNESKTEGNDGHFYRVLDTEDGPVVEHVYAIVDKTKKKSVQPMSAQTTQQNDNPDEGSEGEVTSSDEDLTDVTANDEDSSISSKTRPKEVKRNHQKEQRENSMLQKTRRQNKDDDTSEEGSSKKLDSLITEHEKVEEIPQEEQEKKTVKTSADTLNKNPKKSDTQTVKSNPAYTGQEATDHIKSKTKYKTSSTVEPESNLIKRKRSSKKSSLKKKAQNAVVKESTNTYSSKVIRNEDERHDKEVRQLHAERLGFEGISQNVGLSDISEDEESYLRRLSQQYKFKHQRTQFEKENFNETLTDSFDTNVEEAPIAESVNVDSTEACPDSLQWSNPQVEYGQKERPGDLGDSRKPNENVFLQQQKHIEHLIRQQENVYRQQAEQQKQQQTQSEKLTQQQQELKGQLMMLEQMQHDREQGQLNLSSAVSDHDVKIQKEMVEQQERILKAQQTQQMQNQQQQERILQQQEDLCNQIRQLELQQRDLQTNISSLTPKDKDLSEIRRQEQELIRMLNEQKHHQEQYEQIHRHQLRQTQDKELKVQQERQTLQVQQDFLKSKMIEQEERSKKLEKKLMNVSSKERRNHLSEDSEGSHSLHAISYNDEVDAVPIQRREARKSSKTNKRIHEVISENARLLEVNGSLQQENVVLKQFTEALQKGSSGGSSLVMQQQVKELQGENKVLRETVHRVNVELSRYQTKYRQATVEDFPVMLSKTTTKEPSPWLVNTKFLAPLFLAYDDRLKEREEIIKTYGEEIASFKARFIEIVKENQDLHMRLTQSKPDALDLDEWQQLQEQAKLVVEENSLLMKQQDQLQRKMKELQRSHGQDVSKLSVRIATLESEKRTLETEREDYGRNYANLSQKYKEMVDEEETKINAETHLSVLEECRSVMEDLNSKKNGEIEDLESRLNVIQEEKQNLAVCATDSEAQISQLTKELDAYKKTQRKLERKSLFMERKLEHILEREVTAQQTLSEVLKVAEKTAEERDSFEEFAKSQELKRRKSKSLIHQGDLSIIGLQEKLKQNKKKLNHKVACVTGRLSEKEKEVNKMKEDYEEEINRLRELVRDKQRRMEAIMGERRIFDQQLDMVWKKADQDNQQMKSTIQSTHDHQPMRNTEITKHAMHK